MMMMMIYNDLMRNATGSGEAGDLWIGDCGRSYDVGRCALLLEHLVDDVVKSSAPRHLAEDT